jgi:hypothetical protein
MTKQLTPAQIKELRVFLADYGLEVKAKPKKGLASLRAWKPETPAGRKCKSSMLRWAALPPIKGATLVYKGVLPTFKWPSDANRFFDGSMPWQERAARIHWATPKTFARKSGFSGNH